MISASASRLAPPAGRKLAVVGGCGGIGRALVAAARADGLTVAVLDLPKSLERHPPTGALAIPIDAKDAAAVERAFSELRRAWGALDHLVNLAGFALDRVPIADTPPERWDEVIDGNLRSTYLSCRAALPLLRSGTDATIVNTASGLASRSLPGFGPYSAAKAGVLGLTRALAVENAPAIRVNAVAPTAVDTAFLRGGTGRTDDENSSATHVDVQAYSKTVPLGRIAVAEDVVGPILFLLGPASGYMTGQVLHINGGLLTP